MTSASSEPLVEVKYSRIKNKTTCKTVRDLEESKGKMNEKLKNQAIENLKEPLRNF